MNKKTSIMIITNANSIWSKRYIENVILPLNMEAVIVSNTNSKYKDYYMSENVQVITTIENTWYSRIKGLRSFLGQKKLESIIRASSCDYINAFFVLYTTIDSLSKMDKVDNLVLTFWGSDLYRNQHKNLDNEIKVIQESKSVVVMSSDMKTHFELVYGDQYKDKLSVIEMGIVGFDIIDQYRNDRDNLRRKLYGLVNSEKKIVTIGYNANKLQQQNYVIKALKNVRPIIKEGIHLVLPMTYGRSDMSYIAEIEHLAKDSGFTYSILTEFMDDQEMASLSLSSDYFINSQTTDAISATMLEHIYAGAIVINGAWLQYQPLTEMGINCVIFEAFSELTDMFNNGVEYDHHYYQDIQALRSRFSLQASRDKWGKIYSL